MTARLIDFTEAGRVSLATVEVDGETREVRTTMPREVFEKQLAEYNKAEG